MKYDDVPQLWLLSPAHEDAQRAWEKGGVWEEIGAGTVTWLGVALLPFLPRESSARESSADKKDPPPWGEASQPKIPLLGEK